MGDVREKVGRSGKGGVGKRAGKMNRTDESRGEKEVGA
jgi:hypothetical protein